MRPLYLLPATAVGLIVLNAFFGHLVFGPPYGHELSRYSVYVHLGDGWDSRPGNILFEVTNVWPGPGSREAGPDPGAYNEHRLLHQGGLPYVELRHGFGGCGSAWQPLPYRVAVDSVRGAIEHALGERLGADPYASMLPAVEGEGTGAARSFAQFVPACAGPGSDYEYSVSADGGAQFDAYFVDSEARLAEYLGTGEAAHYEGCLAEGMRSFGGSCAGVGEGSGLLVLVPDDLGSSLTRVAVTLRELP